MKKDLNNIKNAYFGAWDLGYAVHNGNEWEKVEAIYLEEEFEELKEKEVIMVKDYEYEVFPGDKLIYLGELLKQEGKSPIEKNQVFLAQQVGDIKFLPSPEKWAILPKYENIELNKFLLV